MKKDSYFNDRLQRVILGTILLFFILPAIEANPQDVAEAAEEILIKSVDVEGNLKIGTSVIISKIKTRQGLPFSERLISEDIKRLYETGYFKDINVDTSFTDGGVEVVFKVEERPVISSISIKGATKFRESYLITKQMNIKNGDFLDITKLEDNLRQIEQLYEKKGYIGTQITYTLEEQPENKVDVIIKIEEPKRIRIKKISFEGNEAFTGKKLLKLMKTRPAWWFRAGFFKEEQFKDDLGRIETFYHSYGYDEVEISFETEVKNSWMYITIYIDEGNTYPVGEVTIEGNKDFSTEELMDILQLRKDDVFIRDSMEEDLSHLYSFYYDVGYIMAEIREFSYLNPKTQKVDIGYKINEHEQIYVDRVKIIGNTKTKDVVIRRELRILPGEKFDGEKIRKSKDRLRNLGYFEDIRLDTEPTDVPGRRDLLVEVKETKTGSFSFGGGYSSIDDFVGFVELVQSNFDFLNFPTFTGAGQRISIRAEFGTRKEMFDLSFTNPWIFNRPISFGFDAYDMSYERSTETGYGYNEDVMGGRVRLGREFTDTLSGQVAYGYDKIKISEVSTRASAALRREEGENSISLIEGILAYDTRDYKFSPRSGVLITNTAEVAGGFLGADKDFYKYFGRASKYLPLISQSVLEFRVRTGIAEPYDNTKYVPIYERFFAGGSRSVRGYHERKIGPIDPTTKDPLGGEAILVGNVEFTYPLWRPIKVAAFFDAGNVWERASDMGSGKIYKSVGVGVRVRTPMGPVRLDYGYPLYIEPGETDKEGRFHFSVGTAF